MHSGPMQSDDNEEIRRNSTPRRVRFILLTLGIEGSNSCGQPQLRVTKSNLSLWLGTVAFCVFSLNDTPLPSLPKTHLLPVL